jgi:hypothetical protein
MTTRQETYAEALAALEEDLARAEADHQKALGVFQATQARLNRTRSAAAALRDVVSDAQATGKAELVGQPPAPEANGRRDDLPLGGPEAGGDATLVSNVTTHMRRIRRHTRDDILKLMGEIPRALWALDEMEAALRARGWTEHMESPRQAVRKALQRLVQEGAVREPTKDVYVLSVRERPIEVR